MQVFVGQPILVCPCVGVHQKTSLMSSSLLLQQCPAYLVYLGWFVKRKGSGHSVAVLRGAGSKIYSKQHAPFSYSSHLAFSPSILSPSRETIQNCQYYY